MGGDQQAPLAELPGDGPEEQAAELEEVPVVFRRWRVRELLVGGAEERSQDVGPGKLKALEALGRDRPQKAPVGTERILKQQVVPIEKSVP